MISNCLKHYMEPHTVEDVLNGRLIANKSPKLLLEHNSPDCLGTLLLYTYVYRRLTVHCRQFMNLYM